MGVNIRQLHKVFFGEVSGVDMRRTTIAGDGPTVEQVPAA